MKLRPVPDPLPTAPRPKDDGLYHVRLALKGHVQRLRTIESEHGVRFEPDPEVTASRLMKALREAHQTPATTAPFAGTVDVLPGGDFKVKSAVAGATRHLVDTLNLLHRKEPWVDVRKVLQAFLKLRAR